MVRDRISDVRRVDLRRDPFALKPSPVDASMTVCKFFLQGNCRFGETCKNEHRAPRPHESEFNEWRRNNPTSFGGQANAFGSTGNADDNHATRKGWSTQIIYDSLKTERPSWPLTSFGAPFFNSLIHGDLSPEELHLAAVEAQRNGQFPEWQQECDARAQQVKAEEANVLQNLDQAWRYNANDPYYPAGKTEGTTSSFGGVSAFGGGTTSAFGQGSTTNAFGAPAATSSFSNPSSFGSSPFGAMPASAFSLGSRGQGSTTAPSAFSAPSAFTNPSTTAFSQPTTSAFSQPTPLAFSQQPPAFAAPAAPSALGMQNATTPAFGAAPSFGVTSLPSAPLSTATFGQPSVLGASGLPPPPTMGLASRPTFGQTSGLGILGGTSGPPAFGQASSFSSPFAGGLGKSLGGPTAPTFGTKSSFGSFATTNQPNAFAAAAAQPSPFMHPPSQPAAFQTGAFGDVNRFSALGEIRGADRDDDMADDDVATVVMGASEPASGMSTPVSSNPTPFAPVPTLPAVQERTETQSLSNAFGGLSTAAPPQPGAAATAIHPAPATVVNAQNLSRADTRPLPGPSSTARAVRKPVIDEMAAWRADTFTIGMIPETEPPVEVR